MAIDCMVQVHDKKRVTKLTLLCQLLKFHQNYNCLIFKTFNTLNDRLNLSTFLCVQFVVHEAPGQELEIELFDEDTDKDDALGR